MKFTQLKEDIAAGAKNIYLFEGDDAYFRDSAERLVKNAFLQNGELNFSAFDGSLFKGAALTEITSAASAFPFMSDYRIIKVSELYPTEGDYEKYLKPLFENFPQTTILMIVNSQSKKGVDLKRKKCVTYVDCNRADEQTLAKWVYLTLKRAGVSSTVEACEAVVDYCVRDMARISRETQKLAEWADGGSVTIKDVDALVNKDAEYRVYEMTRALARKDANTFVVIMNDLLSRGMDENAVIAALLNYLKNMLALLNLTDEEAAGYLKFSDWQIKKNREEAKLLGEERLEGLIPALYSLSSGLKGGLITAEGALNVALAKVLFS